MTVQHQSRCLNHREPFGAVQTGTTVRLAVHVDRNHDNNPIQTVTLVYAYGLRSFERSQKRLERTAQQSGCQDCYSLSVTMPSEACLFFYWFEIETETGRFFLTRNRDDLSGGSLISNKEPRFLPGQPQTPQAWQITVYEKTFDVPDWLTGHVIYQIFPDRFNRDAAFQPERFQVHDRPERLFHENWDDEVDIAGKPETGYLACDFFGGSLNGIREKLDYLYRMGVSVLYLNPIFEARSNHRYDTADYRRIDPLLGTESDFSALCDEAKRLGIRIILDGVFNHTGADSRYFNKYKRYDDTGAWQEANGEGLSPYGSWYSFSHMNGQVSYDAWWGFAELPSVNEQDLMYRDFIAGSEGIVRHWLRLGASGWRLDVSDELPDFFLRAIRQAARDEKDDAAIIGEVWEDASNKISYGYYRDFLFGRTHDSVMNYPFRRALTGWLIGHFGAERMHHQLETLREHYPEPALYSAYNLISSHDIERALTTLAGDPDPGTREQQAVLRLSDEQRKRGEKLIRLAILFQMVYPGCPVIYYGDEVGMEGYRDPFNRRTFPWGSGQTELQAFVARLGCLRRDWLVLRSGRLTTHLAHQDCIVMERMLLKESDRSGDDGPSSVFVALNRSDEPRTITTGEKTITLDAFGWVFEADHQPIELNPGTV